MTRPGRTAPHGQDPIIPHPAGVRYPARVTGLGTAAHRALIEQVVAHYRTDGRVRAIAVFGSVSAGTWHELSDIDLDIVTRDDAMVTPGRETEALFGSRVAAVVTGPDCADVVLGSLEEVSIRWHPLAATSPNVCASLRVVHGDLATGEIVAAGEANRAQPDEQQLLDALVRDAVYAGKSLSRGRRWEAAAAVERMRRSLRSLRGQRDGLRLDPADPAGALAAVIAETAESFDLGARRWDVLERAGVPRPRLAGRARRGSTGLTVPGGWRYARRMRGSVTVHMAAPAGRVWDLVSDITRVREFSPETFEAEWLGGASGPAAGARFRGHVRRNGRGPVYWTVCTVTACVPGREFAFAVAGPGGSTINTWRYQLEPGAGGTDVTESFELADKLPVRLYWMVAGRARGRTNLDGMRATLERIKAVSEAAGDSR